MYVSTLEVDNYNKTAKEKVKIYYGFFKGTNDPFKMYVRGWGLQKHRQFQSEVLYIKNKYRVPMLALSIKFTTEEQTGTVKDTGKPYITYKPVFNIQKENNKPMFEKGDKRITFLIDAAHRFREISLTSENDYKQNEIVTDVT